MNAFRDLIYRPFFRRLIWLVFTVLFFYSGLYFTEWILAPETVIDGPLKWVLVSLFPLLLPLFFVVNRRFGCASGSCGLAANSDHRSDQRGSSAHVMRMPGA